MKHVFIVIFSAISFTTYAAQLTENEALARLSTSTVKNKSLATSDLVYTKTDGENNLFYVFQSTDGLQIVSADDCALPLLGYCDGTFDLDALPTNVSGWLSYYASTISSAIAANSASVTSLKSTHTAIEPMIKTTWNQSAPYNNLCPTLGDDRCVTGCIATAMAQVMNFHQHPTTGSGSVSYTWNDSELAEDISEITFDWANMANDYSGSTTDAQKTAVATLMAACGYGAKMDYAIDGSGSAYNYATPALINYFGYDDSAIVWSRDYYADDWEELIYSELASGRPVLYSGQSDDGGHAFICDGYQNGYFHINWGWGGLCDGYFLLDILDPDNSASSEAGYKTNQQAVLNVMPDDGVTSDNVYFTASGDFVTDQSEYAKNASQVIYFFDDTNYMSNLTATSKSINFGIKLTDTQGVTSYIKSANNDTRYENCTWTSGTEYGVIQFALYANSMPDDGIYVVEPMVVLLDDNTWVELHVNTSKNASLRAKCTSDAVIFVKSDELFDGENVNENSSDEVEEDEEEFDDENYPNAPKEYTFGPNNFGNSLKISSPRVITSVEILSSDGEIITSETGKKRSIDLDFSGLDSQAKYIIRVLCEKQ